VDWIEENVNRVGFGWGNLKGRLLGRPWPRWEGNVKMNFDVF